MPSVRSRNTTSRKVASSTTASPREARQQRRELVLLRHVPGHRRKHGGQCRKRNVSRERRTHEHEQQQEGRMHHAGDGTASAGAYIGRRARDRAGHADAAEQGRGDVGDALRHQFGIRAMTASGHAVGDDRRQQAFDTAQQRERERRRKHFLDFIERQDRQMRHGKRTRNAAEAAADGFDVQAE